MEGIGECFPIAGLGTTSSSLRAKISTYKLLHLSFSYYRECNRNRLPQFYGSMVNAVDVVQPWQYQLSNLGDISENGG
jgi:hypothetical protein